MFEYPFFLLRRYFFPYPLLPQPLFFFLGGCWVSGGFFEKMKTLFFPSGRRRPPIKSGRPIFSLFLVWRSLGRFFFLLFRGAGSFFSFSGMGFPPWGNEFWPLCFDAISHHSSTSHPFFAWSPFWGSCLQKGPQAS